MLEVGGQRSGKTGIWSSDLGAATPLSEWMIELAEQVGMIEPQLLSGALLRTGVIVGSAVVEKVTPVDRWFKWRLVDVRRAEHLRKPSGHPQPVWFRPF